MNRKKKVIVPEEYYYTFIRCTKLFPSVIYHTICSRGDYIFQREDMNIRIMQI